MASSRSNGSMLPTFSVRPMRAFAQPPLAADFASVVDDINTAVEKGLPTAKRQYKKAAVLMFHWDIDDLSVVPLETELAKAFRDIFKFQVERYTLHAYPAEFDPTLNLRNPIDAFTARYSGSDSLIIIVYSGNALAGPRGPFFESYCCELYGAANPGGAVPHPTVDWNGIRLLSDRMPGDTLYIFDCCFAAQNAVSEEDTEYLASNGIEYTSTIDPQRRLTNRLTNLFKRFQGQAMSVAAYASYLISESRHPETCMDNAPVYIPSFTKPSIVLAPLEGEETQMTKLDTTNINNGKVIVTISFAGDATMPSIEQFKRYLSATVPSQVADIEVAAAFGASSSELLIVSMPTMVWAVLKENPSINFLAHVNTPNILTRPPVPIEMMIRPKGQENIPLASSS